MLNNYPTFKVTECSTIFRNVLLCIVWAPLALHSLCNSSCEARTHLACPQEQDAVALWSTPRAEKPTGCCGQTSGQSECLAHQHICVQDRNTKVMQWLSRDAAICASVILLPQEKFAVTEFSPVFQELLLTYLQEELSLPSLYTIVTCLWISHNLCRYLFCTATDLLIAISITCIWGFRHKQF